MTDKNRRTYYRINYSESNAPAFLWSGNSYTVLDISEEGVRFRNTSTSNISPTTPIAGSLNFRDGESFLLMGRVTRVTQNEVCLKLKHPIPLRKIMDEQRALISGPKKKAS